MALTHDTPAAVSFLRAIEPTGPWLLVAINPDPSPNANERIVDLAEFSITEKELLHTWIEARQGKWSIYFTSNLPAHNPFRTAKKEAVQQLRTLHVDVDLPGSADNKELSEKLLNDIRSLVPQPTLIVFTGGGYQAMWLFKEKLEAKEYTHQVEAANTIIHKQLKGDPCHDVSRLLRLPGTINMPNAKKWAKGRVPILARVIDINLDKRWSLYDPVPHLPDDQQPLPTEAPKQHSEDESGILATLPSALQKLIKSGDPTNFKNDRSRLGWYVMCELVRRGWINEDITKIFLDQTNGISAHYHDQSNPTTYIARNIIRVRESISLDWKRHPKTREILIKDQENVDKALNTLGIKLSHDALADRVWLNGAGPARRLSDGEIDSVWLKIQSEFGFLPDKPFFHTVFTVRAREHSFHPVMEYLDKAQAKYDGGHLIGDFNNPSWLTRYANVEDTPYTRAIGRLTLVAAVRRMRQPGCKFDEMLMLVDPAQGTNKSSAVRTLSVNENWFNDYLPLGEVGREVIEHIRGFWIIEAQEMAGMTAKDVDRIKGFCSRQTDRGRMSYDHLVTDLPRSCVFIGTTNEETLFTDLLNRRYWPVSIMQEFDLDHMKSELDQLWGEAAVAEAAGESIRLDRHLWPIAAEVQSRYRVEDSWSTLLDQHLGNLNGRLTSVDLYRIINKQAGSVLHTDGRRLGRAMREIGFERRQIRDGSSPNQRWYYIRGSSEDERRQEIYVFRDPITGEISVSNNTINSADIEERQTQQTRAEQDLPF